MPCCRALQPWYAVVLSIPTNTPTPTPTHATAGPTPQHLQPYVCCSGLQHCGNDKLHLGFRSQNRSVPAANRGRVQGHGQVQGQGQGTLATLDSVHGQELARDKGYAGPPERRSRVAWSPGLGSHQSYDRPARPSNQFPIRTTKIKGPVPRAECGRQNELRREPAPGP